MSYFFENHNGSSFYWNKVCWCFVLDLARLYGWQAQGTVFPEWDQHRRPGKAIEGQSHVDSDLNGDYLIVVAEEAHALATALEAALPDIPDVYVKRVPSGHALEVEVCSWVLPEGFIDGPLANGFVDGYLAKAPIVSYAHCPVIEAVDEGSEEPSTLCAAAWTWWGDSSLRDDNLTFWHGRKQRLQEFIDFCRQGLFTII